MSELEQRRARLAAYWGVPITDLGTVIRKHMQVLSQRDCDILCRFQGIHKYTFDLLPEERTISDIAKFFGISHAGVSLILLKAKHIILLALFREQKKLPDYPSDWTLEQLLTIPGMASKANKGLRTRLMFVLRHDYANYLGHDTDLVPVRWLVEKTIKELHSVDGVGPKGRRLLLALVGAVGLQFAPEEPDPKQLEQCPELLRLIQ